MFWLNLKDYANKYFGILSSIIFFAGFIIDYIFLPAITNVSMIYFSVVYFISLGILIYVKEIFYKNNIFLNFIISFISGSYASFVFVYYIRGGDLLINLPILSVILFFMFANEFIKKKYRLLVELLTYSIITIFYFIFLIPVITRSLSDKEFYLSLLISFIFLYTYLYCIYQISKDDLRIKLHYFLAVPILFLGFCFYFKVLPAVPLSLHYSSFYGQVESEIVEGEKYYIYDNPISRNLNIFKSYFLRRSAQATDLTNGLYFYSEIEAPIDFNFKITNTWQYYNPNSNSWSIVSEVSYSASGGRKGGYRGYSYINNLKPGKYKVLVLVNDSRYIGSASINVK
ncbi:MAG: hypothetical protein QG614_126 [Patescibacteria group bacterium]|nr:hypothetical protein [Patescibacteria group bacterium]